MLPQRQVSSMTKEERIMRAVHELVEATRKTASSAAQLKDLLLNEEICLVPDATIVHQTATLLQHTTEQFARNRMLRSSCPAYPPEKGAFGLAV